MDLLSPLRELSGTFLPFLDSIPAVRVIMGTILVFFLPGFAWTIVFFRQLKPLERIPISIALSIVLVTLSLLFASRIFGTVINGFNAVLIIVTVTALPVLVHFLVKYTKYRTRKATED